MNDKFTLKQFLNRYPDDDACLEEIKQMRFGNKLECPKCERVNKFYRVAGRTAYACSFCGYQVYPLASTIFHKSTTSLRDWFYAIYLMAQTRAGISAKQLERELGVTYKTAWRMFHQIRKLMADDGDMLTGEIEVDETYVGGAAKNRMRQHLDQQLIDRKAIVIGMVERNGRAKARHIKSNGARVLLPEIQDGVEAGSTVYSDEWRAYYGLTKLGYEHHAINHKEHFKRGMVHTQNVENLWSHIKRGITGVYRHVDAKYLQSYIDEYAFRYSNRQYPHGAMFDLILGKLAKKA